GGTLRRRAVSAAFPQWRLPLPCAVPGPPGRLAGRVSPTPPPPRARAHRHPPWALLATAPVWSALAWAAPEDQADSSGAEPVICVSVPRDSGQVLEEARYRVQAELRAAGFRVESVA